MEVIDTVFHWEDGMFLKHFTRLYTVPSLAVGLVSTRCITSAEPC